MSGHDHDVPQQEEVAGPAGLEVTDVPSVSDAGGAATTAPYVLDTTPHAWAAFRARAWATLGTDLPWWGRMADAEMRRLASGERWSTKTS